MNNSGKSPKMSGLLVGGSGLIGGYLLHYFKTKTPEIDVRAPNSKKLSLRELSDIISYFKRHKPDFVVNTAITAIRSDALLSYEVNYLGSINLARAALALNIPYIHISSAATLPPGENLTEEDHEFAVREWIPRHYDIELEAVRKTIGFLTAEVADMMTATERKKRGEKMVYGVLPAHYPFYRALKFTDPSVNTYFVDANLISLIQPFFHKQLFL